MVEIGGKNTLLYRSTNRLQRCSDEICSAVILTSRASFWGRKASFQSHAGGITIPLDEILWPAKQLGVVGFLF